MMRWFAGASEIISDTPGYLAPQPESPSFFGAPAIEQIGTPSIQDRVPRIRDIAYFTADLYDAAIASLTQARNPINEVHGCGELRPRPTSMTTAARFAITPRC